MKNGIMANEVYLLLGSNEGDRGGNLHKAIALIEKYAAKTTRRSPIYETAAWGKTDQDTFLNEAVCISYEEPAIVLLQTLKSIEIEVGRISTEKWGPRIIDIDILLFDDAIIQTPDLQVPHPYLPVRRFALLPLADIAGEVIHPVLKKTIKQLLAECPDRSEVSLWTVAMDKL